MEPGPVDVPMLVLSPRMIKAWLGVVVGEGEPALAGTSQAACQTLGAPAPHQQLTSGGVGALCP